MHIRPKDFVELDRFGIHHGVCCASAADEQQCGNATAHHATDAMAVTVACREYGIRDRPWQAVLTLELRSDRVHLAYLSKRTAG